MACNGLPPPSCRGGSQEHVRVAWMSGGVLRWQGACARCVGFRQPRVGGRCYRKPPPTAVARVWSGQPKSSIINVRAIGERALRWVLQAVTKTSSRGTPTFHRSARLWRSWLHDGTEAGFGSHSELFLACVFVSSRDAPTFGDHDHRPKTFCPVRL